MCGLPQRSLQAEIGALPDGADQDGSGATEKQEVLEETGNPQDGLADLAATSSKASRVRLSSAPIT